MEDLVGVWPVPEPEVRCYFLMQSLIYYLYVLKAPCLHEAFLVWFVPLGGLSSLTSTKMMHPLPLSSVYTWGSGISTPLRLPMLNTEVIQVSLGRTQKMGVTKSGKLITWEVWWSFFFILTEFHWFFSFQFSVFISIWLYARPPRLDPVSLLCLAPLSRCRPSLSPASWRASLVSRSNRSHVVISSPPV